MGREEYDGSGDGPPEPPWNETVLLVSPGPDNWATFVVPSSLRAFRCDRLVMEPTPPELWVLSVFTEAREHVRRSRCLPRCGVECSERPVFRVVGIQLRRTTAVRGVRRVTQVFDRRRSRLDEAAFARGDAVLFALAVLLERARLRHGYTTESVDALLKRLRKTPESFR